MNHDDIISLVKLGFKLFTDINNATHHHHAHSYLNHDNLSVAGDLAQVGQKLYKIGSAAQSNRSSRLPMFGSEWRVEDGTVMGFAYHKESGVVALSFPRADGNGWNVYSGAGEVYSNSIAIMVSGYNSRTGSLVVIQGISNDGYRINMATWTQGYDIAYDSAVRATEWDYD